MRLISLFFLLLVSTLLHAAPGTILFQDDFNRSNVATGTGAGSTAPGNGVGNGWNVNLTPVGTSPTGSCNSGVTGNTGCAGIDADVPPWNSATLPLALRAHGTGSQSLYLRWSTVAVEHAVNLASKPGANVSFWARRGWDCFSEAPGGGASDPGCKVTATITVSGSGNTSVSGITVNGVQIMSGASTSSASTATVTTNVDAKISLNGFSATSSGNIITITGPGTLAGSYVAGFSPVVTLASGGTMTFTPTVFVNTLPAPFTASYGEEFVAQYLNSASTWVTLAQYPNDGLGGEEFRPSIDLPADALWSGFKLRFYQPSGSGYGGNGGAAGVKGYDYWHVDDVKITELAATSYAGSFCDTFEGDLSRWIMTGTGNAGIGSKYFQNGAHDLDVRWGPVTATTKPTDMTGITGPITFWVKRGVGTLTTVPNTTGSDYPETGKNLVVEYLNASGTWNYLVPATSFLGGGTSGQVYTNSVAIPVDAKLSAFQVRFRLLAGTGYDFDYWHVDDLCIGSSIQSSDLSIAVTPASANLAPGATTTLTATVTNNGPSLAPGPITITDTLAQGLVFVSASAGWSCSATTVTVTCTLTGALAVGASTSLILTVQADPVASGTFTNTVAVGSPSSNDTALANNTATNAYTFVAALFEAYETTTTPTNSASGGIFTKLAGQSFNLKVMAINSGAINAAYNKTVTVDLINGAASCVAATAALTGVTVTPVSHLYTGSGTGKDNGVYIYAFTSTNAYANVQVRMKDDIGAVGCSSDKFAIRPQSFTLSSSNANADNTGASTAASPKLKVGAPFSLTADTSIVGYNGTPKLNASMVFAHTGAVLIGTLSGAFGAANASTGNGATGASFTYDEVGYFRLNADGVYDDTFTVVDSATADCVTGSSNTADASGKFGCNIANTSATNYFGRFIPDHFETVLTPGCATFTYSAQPFTLKVTAYKAAGAGGGSIAKNYAGAYSKALTLTEANAVGGSLSSTSVATGSFSAGEYTNSALSFSFVPVPQLPATIKLRGAELAGGDGVTSLQTAPAVSVEGTTVIRSGRVHLSNAFGSELLDLPMSLTAQYWVDATNGWQTNVADACTTASLAFSAVATTPDITANTCVWDAGTSPGNSGKGCVGASPSGKQYKEAGVSGFTGDFNLNLKAPGSGNAGSIDVTATVPAWLQYNWTGVIGNPKGRATFGIYKSKSGKVIHRREMY